MEEKIKLADGMLRIELGQEDYAVKVVLVHPIASQYYLIEQRVRHDGTIEYYTNGEEEDKTGEVTYFKEHVEPTKDDKEPEDA